MVRGLRRDGLSFCGLVRLQGRRCQFSEHGQCLGDHFSYGEQCYQRKFDHHRCDNVNNRRGINHTGDVNANNGHGINHIGDVNNGHGINHIGDVNNEHGVNHIGDVNNEHGVNHRNAGDVK